MKWEMLDNNIAYIKIYQFTSNLPDKFKDAVSGLLKNNAKIGPVYSCMQLRAIELYGFVKGQNALPGL